jgi:transposase-like protein
MTAGHATLPSMKTGKCPKCSGQNVYVCKTGGSDADTASGWFAHVPMPYQRYACNDCRFTECYLRDDMFSKSLDAYEGWDRVGAPTGGPFR